MTVLSAAQFWADVNVITGQVLFVPLCVLAVLRGHSSPQGKQTWNYLCTVALVLVAVFIAPQPTNHDSLSLSLLVAVVRKKGMDYSHSIFIGRK